jgi:hypothetical protein
MKTNPEFDNFTAFMDKLAQVPNSEVKAALEAENADKRLKRTAPAFKKSLDPKDYHLGKERGQNPLVNVANEVFKKAARRKLN